MSTYTCMRLNAWFMRGQTSATRCFIYISETLLFPLKQASIARIYNPT